MQHNPYLFSYETSTNELVKVTGRKNSVRYLQYIYHINCGVIQGFPALRKAYCVFMINKIIHRSDEELTLERSALRTLYGG